MSEEQIIQAITNICQDSSIHFQIIIQDYTLHIYINRQTDIDYQLITRQIYTAVSSIQGLAINGIYLHSRLLGTVEPDWQTYLSLKEASKAALDSIHYLAIEITTEIEHTNKLVNQLKHELQGSFSIKSIVDQVENISSLISKLKKQLRTKTFDSLVEEFGEDSTGELTEEANNQYRKVNQNKAKLNSSALNLSKYCFISDKKLLVSNTFPSNSNLVKLIMIFDKFTISNKRAQLPILESYFQTIQNPNLDNLDQSTKNWWDQILQLDSDNKLQLALWLNHYCQDRDKTMSMANTIYNIETAAKVQIFLGILLIETAIHNQNKALIYFCLSHNSGDNLNQIP